MRGVTAYAAGLALVSGLWFFGVAWPLTEGYPSLLHWLGDRIISDQEPQHDRARLRVELTAAGFELGDPAHIRIFKQERRLEVWMQRAGGRYALFKSYPICNYSGELGPKLNEGDHQAPEGYYRIARAQLNPNSRHHLAFIWAFPMPSTGSSRARDRR
jgi:murein L,D-transpeptidase YafK